MSNMLLRKNPLFDQEFLNNLFSCNQQEIYAKIILLNVREEPIEQIEGKIVDGSVNIDGTSAVRRTCSLSMVAEDVNIHEFYWGLKNKFKLEVGLKNDINPIYPDIIWFKQGIFVITQFNTSQSLNKWDIKIQGKDKMCLLNGEVSGQLPLADFAVEQITDTSTGEITFVKLPIKTIIKKLLQEFALELPHNIIINDIDEAGQELLEYQGTEPLYLFRNIETDEFENMTINGEAECYYQLQKILTQEQYDMIPSDYDYLKTYYVRNDIGKYEFNEILANEDSEFKSNTKGDWFKGRLADSFSIIYDNLLDNAEFSGDKEPSVIKFLKNNSLSEESYYLICLQAGDSPGYRMTDLIYAGELKSNAGEAITSILDKIKNQFVHFEYYYDLDGKFVFQRKKEYLDLPWNSVETTTERFNAGINDSQVLFNFVDNKLVISFGNSPNLIEVKNDYSVHGRRGNTPIHMRYAIDNKPTEYLPIRVLKEKIVSIYRNSQSQIIKTEIDEKFYDAPEIEPYNELGLIGTDASYRVLEFLDFRINNLNAGVDSHIFGNMEFKEFSESIDPAMIGQDFYDSWFSLFKFDNRLQYLWTGTNEDIKNMVMALNKNAGQYGNEVQMSIVPTGEGGEVWRIIYPYYARYPYSTQHIVMDKDNNILYKDEIEPEDIVIHYKVDWRELIYQMSLDYRKLNSTDDYYYYLMQANPQFIYGRTNYEQYYVDMSLWRDLYNPNPPLVYEKNINYSDVKRQSLLTDDNESNDNLDQIYVKGGYKLITPEDQKKNLTYMDIYQYSKPKDSEILSLYPFFTSSAGCLEEEGIKYYIEDTISKRMKDTYEIKDNKVCLKKEYYQILADSSPTKIFIKNDKRLDTKSFRAIEVNISQANYQPHTYYIKSENQYVLSSSYVAGQKYFELTPTSEYEQGTQSTTGEFRVLSYPTSTTLNSEYESKATADYVVYAENKFAKDEIQEQIFNEDNTTFFTKDDSYIKLADIKEDANLYGLYYRSFLFPLAYKTSALIDNLDNVILVVKDQYKENPVKYLAKISDILKEYLVHLESYDCDDVKQILYEELFGLINQYKNTLQTFGEKELQFNIEDDNIKTDNDFLDYEISCLPHIQEILIEALNKINLNLDENSSLNQKLLSIIIYFNNLNLIAQTAFNGLFLNYGQVKNIGVSIKDILKLDFPNNFNDQIGQINDLLTALEADLSSLTRIKDTYVEGQLEKTKKLISLLLDEANAQKKIIDSTSNEEQKQNLSRALLTKLREDSIIIVSVISLLSKELNTFQDNLFSQMVWTPSLDELEDAEKSENAEDAKKNIFNAAKTNHIMYKLLVKIKDLITIISKINDTNILTIARDALTFNNKIFFNSLYENLTAIHSNAEAVALIEEFIQNTSDFQEHIILEDVNNFNKIDGSNKVFYYPIQYYKASYHYEHEPEIGNFWLLDIFNSPELLNFWIDFLEPTSEDILKYSVPAIGVRSKVINDTLVTALHHKEVPSIIFRDVTKVDYTEISGYTYINLTKAFMNLFKVSSKGKTAKNRIEELLTNHSYCTESVNISTTPVYNLVPNYKIHLRDDNCNINGEYTITKISIPLSYKKMMSITATKAVSSII